MKSAMASTITLALILAGLFSGQLTGLTQAVREPQTVASRPAQIAPSENLNDDDKINKELSAILEKAAAADAFSGTVLVAKNGQPIFSKAYGSASKSANSPNNVETKFNIGSMNKMFTAVAIAQLAERGKLSFDDTIGKHLSDYPNQAIAGKVTIHQLLTHTSGMGSYQNERFFAQLDKMKTIADLLPLFVNEPLAFEPGAKWQYSNSGYVVLGAIIEKVSGQNYFAYVREHIFKPAGMSNTDSYEKDANTPNLAIGLTRMNSNGQPEPTTPRRENTSSRPAKGSPAGGGYSTVGDLLKFVVALQNHQLLNKKFTEIVTTGKIEVGGPMGKYAYGFGDKIFNGKHIVGHNGGAPGIAANLDIFPELGYTSIILSNYDPPAVMPLIMKIRELIPSASSSVLQQPQKPHAEQSLSQDEREVRKLEREWLDAYEKRDAEAMNRILTDDFKLSFSNGMVQTKADILAQLKAGRDSGLPAPKFSTEDVQSRVEGETVVLTGRVIQQMERDGQTRMMQMLYTDTYAKRQGRWQVSASQLTRIQP
jgi:CubicO group peptidase (beta-lactamase class C family)